MTALPKIVEPQQVNLPTAAARAADDAFHTSEVVTLAAAHGSHDTFFSFLPTVLPLLIEKFSLATGQAGLLTLCSQLPTLAQPFIGYLADHKNLRALIILAPALSATLITLIGVAPSYGAIALLVLLAGFSSAGFHAIAPALAGARSGRQIGRGMGFFMVGGEVGYTFGPLLAVAATGMLTLNGLPWLMTLGFLASAVLYLRLPNLTTVRATRDEASLPLKQALGQLRRLMLPIAGYYVFSSCMLANLTSFLPTFLTSEGTAFALAGFSLSLTQLGGMVGVFSLSLVSDRLGQRNVLLVSTLVTVALVLVFLSTSGWIQIALLLVIGLIAFAPNPAFLSIVQSRFPHNRSLANGVFMTVSFFIRALGVVPVGFLAEHFGLRAVFTGSALLALLSIPFLLMLPKK
jgi:MFS transporter, FSR family, fosmidomycin resistance protein